MNFYAVNPSFSVSERTRAPSQAGFYRKHSRRLAGKTSDHRQNNSGLEGKSRVKDRLQRAAVKMFDKRKTPDEDAVQTKAGNEQNKEEKK